MQSDSGTYALLLRSDTDGPLQIGALGNLPLRPGTYLYVGSAFGPGGVRARVRRHLQPKNRRHWHVDYVRDVTTPISIWFTQDPERRECTWASVMRTLSDATVPLAGFGASDCTCESHLVHFPSPPSLATFRKRLHTRVSHHEAVGQVDPSHLETPPMEGPST